MRASVIHCPVCDSMKIEFSEYVKEENQLYRLVKCSDCNSYWKVLYQIEPVAYGIVEITKDNGEIDNNFYSLENIIINNLKNVEL